MSLIMTTSFLLFKAGTTFTYYIVMIVAVVEAMLYDKDFFPTMFDYGNHYLNRGYRGRFAWGLAFKRPLEQYNS